MKVVAFNGSPHKEGNTFHSLQVVGQELTAAGIEFEIVQVGSSSLRGCTACNGCARNKNEKCVLPGDELNTWIQKMKEADGILLGSPVHYAGIGATMKCFLDRAFYVAGVNGGLLRHKVGASVVAVRRSGGSSTFDALNHYITYSEMLLPGSNYWNIAHGTTPGEVLQDEEGLQLLRVLGRNMAWLLKSLDAAKNFVPPPAAEKKIFTNFIR